MRPAFNIAANGNDITGVIRDRLVMLEVTDQAGQTSDSASFTLDDRDGMVSPPPEGTEITVSMGYEETGLVEIGTFSIDEVEFSGPPNVVTVRCSAVRMSPTIAKEQKSQDWHGSTLRELAEEVAKRNGLTLRYEAEQEFTIRHDDQASESDQQLLTRLAERFGVVIKPRNGELVVTPSGEGLLGPSVEIRLEDCERWRARLKDRARYSRASARYLDRKTNTEEKVTVEGQDGFPTLELRQVYRNEDEAKRAAEAKLQAITAGTAAINLVMVGRPELRAEGTANLVGFREELMGEPWIVHSVRHRIDSRGFRTELDCGTPGKEASTWGDISELEPTEEGTYVQGNIGPTSTGPHYHVELVGGGYFGPTALDNYVIVNGRPLSAGTTITSEIGASRDGGARRHAGRDYAVAGRGELKLTNGAKWVGVNRNTGVGDRARFRLPDGRQFEIIHGTFGP